MPPQHRRARSAAAGGARATAEAPTMSSTISSLDARVRLMAQRLKIIENNEQVIGRTLVAHNKKMVDLEKTVAAVSGGIDLGKLKEELSIELTEQIKHINMAPPMQDIIPGRPAPVQAVRQAEMSKETKKELQKLRQDVDELKYTLGNINPLEFVTIDQISDVVKNEIRRQMKKE